VWASAATYGLDEVPFPTEVGTNHGSSLTRPDGSVLITNLILFDHVYKIISIKC
jgi:hypothetical protein